MKSHLDIRNANDKYHQWVAKDYERAHPACFDESGIVAQKLHQNIRHLATATDGGRLLDLGCGTGALLHYAGKYFQPVVGLDLSQEMLSQARQRKLRVLKGDVAKLPFPDATFNAIICISVLHHIFNPTDVLAEMIRVLKPGGWLWTDHDPSRAFFLKWPKVNRFFRRFFRHEEYVGQTFEDQQISVESGEWLNTERDAEFHAGPGLDPPALAQFLNENGCEEVKVEYHFLGDLPGPALKVANRLKLEYGPKIVAPFFRLKARKL